jgi:6,7-dimethyl-8-ribityllumazine synthase
MAGRAPRTHRGDRPGLDGAHFAVVAARFNERISKRLLSGAMRALSSAGVTDEAVELHWVPGSFELPQAAALLARTGRYAAIVCVGCVIKGETPHFDFVAGQAAAGIQQVALETGVPATFGVITALTEAQALARSGGEVGNRGQEAAEAALEMAAFVHAQGSRNRGGSGGGGPRRRRAQTGSAPDRRGGGALRSRPGGY